MEIKLCQVKNCRFSSFHVTRRHQCGKCKLMGHGQIECANTELIKSLQLFDNNIGNVSVWCGVSGCADPFTHITSGHSCAYCGKRNSHLKRCPINDNNHGILSDGSNLYDPNELAKYNLQPGDYTMVWGGMGSSVYIRRNKETDILEFFFMHSDSWGQYGDDTSDVPKINAFTFGYNNIH